MSLKAKTVLNNDIRVFRMDINSIENSFDALKSFIKEKYELNVPFIIQYEDEEQDLITIGTSDDLEEAYNQAETNGTVLKLLIVPENIGIPVYSLTSELDKSEIEAKPKPQQEEQPSLKESDEKNEDTSSNASCGSSDEECNEIFNPIKKLWQDIKQNQQFRDEFIKFLSNLMINLQANIMKLIKDNLEINIQQSNEQIQQHESIQILIKQLPKLMEKYPFILFLIYHINADNIGEWLNMIINHQNSFCSNDDGGSMNFMNIIPMIMHALHSFGGVPPPPPPPPPHPHHGYYHGYPHHGRHGPHGPHGHHYHGFGHGPHHGFGHPHPHPHHFGHHAPPPPPPPPPFNPLMHLIGNLFHNANNMNMYGPPPPPPPPPPQASYHPQCPYKHGGYRSCHYWKNKCHNNKKNYGCNGNGNGKGKYKWWKCKEFKHNNNNNNNNMQVRKDYDVEIIKDDISLADKAYVLPGQVIVKTWRIKNVGEKDIPEGVMLKYEGKLYNPIINGVNFAIPSLKINEECDISVVLETPKKEDQIFGKQKALWKLYLPNNEGTFGPKFRVRIFIIDNDNEPQVEESKSEENDIKIQQQEQILKQELKKEQQEQVYKVVEEQPIKNMQLINNNNNNNDDLNDIYFNEPIVPMVAKVQEEEKIEILPVTENQQVIEVVKEELNNEIVPPVDDMEIEMMDNNNNNNNNEPIIISEKIIEPPIEIPMQEQVDPDENYIYLEQLNALIDMGMDNKDYLRQLLNEHKGNINAVINILFS